MTEEPHISTPDPTRRQVLAATVGTPMLGGAAAAADGSDVDGGKLQDAIVDARSHLFDMQEPGGYWVSKTRSTADQRVAFQYALVLHYHGVKEEEKMAAVDWLLSERDPDGGWGDPRPNFLSLLLFDLLDEDYSDVVADVKAENEREGYTMSTDVEGFAEELHTGMTRVKLLYLLLGDDYDREDVFPPKATESILGMLQMSRAFEDGEINPRGAFIQRPLQDLFLAMANLMAVTDEDSEAAEELVDLTTKLLLERRAPNGVWGSTVRGVMFSTVALAEAGYEPDDFEISKPLDWLTERQRPSGRLVHHLMPVFDSGWAIDGLVASGVSPEDDRVKSAAQHLWNIKISAPRGKRKNEPLDWPRPRPPFSENPWGGWGYRGQAITDWDDTAAGVLGFGPYESQAIQKEIDYLISVQGPNGGWGTWHKRNDIAFDEEAREKLRQRFGDGWDRIEILFNDHEVVDITGHCLVALGAHGYTVDDSEAVRDAVDWLWERQGEKAHERPGRGELEPTEEGLWPCARDPIDVYCTSRAIVGMEAVGVDMDRPEIDSAVAAIIDEQNDDGSWGDEDVKQMQTARALMGLLTADVAPDNPAVEAGIRFLLDTQQDDGSWPVGLFLMFTNSNVFNYSQEVLNQAVTLKVLSMYADARDVPYEPDDDGLGLVDAVTGVVGVAAVAGVARRLLKGRRGSE